MKRLLAVFGLIACSPAVGSAQVMGNAGYARGESGARPEANERVKRALSREQMPPTPTSQFIEADVLMNVKADEYVAVFAVAQEGRDAAECGQKLNARLAGFTGALRQLGVPPNDVFVDFIAQTRIYEFEVANEVAKEKLAGFELKKNVSIHYRDKLLLDRLILAAAEAEIFDLIKVDYIVKDTRAVQKALMEEASRVIQQKAAEYERLLGVRLLPRAQVYAQKNNTYFPTEMYDAYVAQESENVSAGANRQRYVVQGLRKSRTFYFDPLSARSFDRVVNPVVLEPVVQFTLYLKVKYEIETPGKSGRPAPARPGRGKGTPASRP